MNFWSWKIEIAFSYKAYSSKSCFYLQLRKKTFFYSVLLQRYKNRSMSRSVSFQSWGKAQTYRSGQLVLMKDDHVVWRKKNAQITCFFLQAPTFSLVSPHTQTVSTLYFLACKERTKTKPTCPLPRQHTRMMSSGHRWDPQHL